MPANYSYYDAFGIERTITGVLNPVQLTSVETNVTPGTENLVTVSSTASLYPGMPFACPNIPQAAFIHAVKSATVVELYATAWNATTGVFTTSKANANATAAATDLQAVASGFCPRTIVSLAYPMGTWRNLFTAGGYTNAAGTATVLPGTLTATTFITSGTTLIGTTQFASDQLNATPLKRHNGEPWGIYIFVSTGGFQSLVQAIPGREPLYSGVTT